LIDVKVMKSALVRLKLVTVCRLLCSLIAGLLF
jgi:hypothetical protein